MLWTLGPYLYEKAAILKRPWLFELAESYNEIVNMLPAHWELINQLKSNYHGYYIKRKLDQWKI